MKKTRNLLKAVVALAVVFAFALPTSAALANTNPQILDNTQKLVPPGPLSFQGQWIQQVSGLLGSSRGVNYVHAVDENIVWAVGYDGSGSSTPVQEFTKTVNGGDLWEADLISEAPADADAATASFTAQ